MKSNVSASASAFAGVLGSVSNSRAGELQPHDARLNLFTAADRSTFLATTGVDIRPNGEIVSPINMDPLDLIATMRTAGRVLNNRASGNQEALSVGSLTSMLKQDGWTGSDKDAKSIHPNYRRDLYA